MSCRRSSLHDRHSPGWALKETLWKHIDGKHLQSRVRLAARGSAVPPITAISRGRVFQCSAENVRLILNRQLSFLERRVFGVNSSSLHLRQSINVARSRSFPGRTPLAMAQSLIYKPPPRSRTPRQVSVQSLSRSTTLNHSIIRRRPPRSHVCHYRRREGQVLRLYHLWCVTLDVSKRSPPSLTRMLG